VKAEKPLPGFFSDRVRRENGDSSMNRGRVGARGTSAQKKRPGASPTAFRIN